MHARHFYFYQVFIGDLSESCFKIESCPTKKRHLSQPEPFIILKFLKAFL